MSLPQVQTDELIPTKLTNSSVLVTGGAGFIGSHLADALVDTTDVRILDNLSSGSLDNIPAGATFIEGDIRNERTVSEATDGVDIIFHHAANSSVQKSIDTPKQSHEINIIGSTNILEAARKADARVISASSAAIYGVPNNVPISESHRKKPTSQYGVEKLALDRDTLLYNDIYGLPTVSLRYFNVYGPRQIAGQYSGVIDVFLGQARNGEDITIDGDGSQTRDFVHVLDIVKANLLAAVTEHVGMPFNIGSGGSVTIETLAKKVRTVTGSSSDLTYTEPRPGDIPQSCADITRASEKLGYDPSLSLESGLQTLTASSDADNIATITSEYE